MIFGTAYVYFIKSDIWFLSFAPFSLNVLFGVCLYQNNAE
jgi:hypothetical protein